MTSCLAGVRAPPARKRHLPMPDCNLLISTTLRLILSEIFCLYSAPPGTGTRKVRRSTEVAFVALTYAKFAVQRAVEDVTLLSSTGRGQELACRAWTVFSHSQTPCPAHNQATTSGMEASPLAAGLAHAVSDVHLPAGPPRRPGGAAEQGAPPSPQNRPAHRGSNHHLLPPQQRVRLALASNPAEYLAGLGRLAPAARPASLQPLLKQGRCTPSTLCLPKLDATARSLADLHADSSGQLLPEEGTAQCHLSLRIAADLPPTGVRERKCWLTVARLCLFDGACFHGNVQVRSRS